MAHTIALIKPSYEAIIKRERLQLLRKKDTESPFEVDELLNIVEFQLSEQKLTGRSCKVRISHITPGTGIVPIIGNGLTIGWLSLSLSLLTVSIGDYDYDYNFVSFSGAAA